MVLASAVDALAMPDVRDRDDTRDVVDEVDDPIIAEADTPTAPSELLAAAGAGFDNEREDLGFEPLLYLWREFHESPRGG